MRYSAVVNYIGAVEIPLLPRHPASSSSSASIAASQPTPATLADGFSAPTAQQQGSHNYVQRPLPPAQVLLVDLIPTNTRNYCVFVVILYSNRTGRPPLFPTAGDDNTYSAAAADLYARRFQTTGLSVIGGRYSFLVHSAYVPTYFRHDH
jgi:hypothetical protein